MRDGAKRFSAMLQAVGLSQREAAKEIGCSQGQVHNIAAGKRPPTLDQAFAIEELSTRLGWADGPLEVDEWRLGAETDAA